MNTAAHDDDASAAMLTRTGRVVSVSAEHVVVRFERESACSACRAAKVCAGSAPTRDLAVPRPLHRHLLPGDPVQVGVAEASALRATAIAYMTPLAGLLAGMALASAAGLTEGVVGLASLAGLGAGFVAMQRIARNPVNHVAPILLEAPVSDTPKENHP